MNGRDHVLEYWVCLQYLDRSKVLGLVGSFSKEVLEFVLAFLGCLLMGALCHLLDVVCIVSIHFDDNVGLYWVG